MVVIALPRIDGKEYTETIRTVPDAGENNYDYQRSYQQVSQQVYQLKPTKEYVYRTSNPVSVYDQPTPKPTYVLKASADGKSSPVSSPQADYVAYYPYAYAVPEATSAPQVSHASLSKATAHVHLHSKDTEESKQYKYGYRVTDPHHGAEFGHSEVNDGETAKGYYHVLLPDGRLQNVKYWADENGFNAVISYEK
ncbi:hypothetical protein RUM43_008990 [Polyplax serrata]|uniref:Uncharacterized protein n=1 Tax=Polyplax serrata TaxID=468196 RepID=A0AAN8PHE8_POLSC